MMLEFQLLLPVMRPFASYAHLRHIVLAVLLVSTYQAVQHVTPVFLIARHVLLLQTAKPVRLDTRM